MHETPNAFGSNGLVAAEMSNTPVKPPARVKQIWRQARRSLTFGLIVASGFAICFWALATQMLRLPVSYQSMTTFSVSTQLGHRCTVFNAGIRP